MIAFFNFQRFFAISEKVYILKVYVTTLHLFMHLPISVIKFLLLKRKNGWGKRCSTKCPLIENLYHASNFYNH